MTPPSVMNGPARSRRLVFAGVTSNTAVGTLFAWSLVAEDAARDVGLPPGGAASVFATAVAVFTVVLLGVGRVGPRLGSRPKLVLAAAAGGAGLLLAALWHDPRALWWGVGGLFGSAGGLAYSASTSLAARVPRGRRGTATGLVVAAYAGAPVLLGVVGPPLLADHGWRVSVAGLGFLVAGLLLVAARTAPREEPRAVGSHGGRPDPGTARGTVALMWLVFAGGTAPALMVFAHAAPLAAVRGLTGGGTGMAVSALAGGNLAGRVIAGWLSDRLGRIPALAWTLSLSAAAVLGLATLSGLVGLLISFVALGFSYGAVSALVPAATADLVGAASFSGAYARVFSAWGVAGLAGPVAGAWLLQTSVTTPAMLMLAGLPLLPAAAALLALHRRRHGVLIGRAGT